jgi:ABC-type uncharacterized transport system substrate-binding protein
MLTRRQTLNLFRHAALATLFVSATSPASAHPHIFIESRVVLTFADNQLTGFSTDWQFDEIFTADMLHQFDTDGDGAINAGESEVMGAETLPNLAGFRYFTQASVDGTDFPDLAPSGFAARVEAGVLHFVLSFTLPQPIDPTKQKLRLEISDRSYYVEVLMAETDPVRLEGPGSEACKVSVKDDPANAYYEGFVIPQAISVACR